jgi:hypothetical protein
MTASKKNSRGINPPPPEKDKAAERVRIDLTDIERELLKKACTTYRYTIPAYIKSRQPEIEALNAIIEKLA